MSGGVAPGPRAECLVAGTVPRRGDRGGRVGRLPAGVAPLTMPAWAFYAKDDVFDLCDTLARAERALIEAGRREEGAQVARAFELLEAGLA